MRKSRTVCVVLGIVDLRPQRAETQGVPRLPRMEGAAEVSGDKRGDKTTPAGWKLTARALFPIALQANFVSFSVLFHF